MITRRCLLQSAGGLGIASFGCSRTSGGNAAISLSGPSIQRPLLSKLDAGYVEKLRLAYSLMKAMPDALGLASQADLHKHASISLIAHDEKTPHCNAWFLPWHRALLYYHERILGSLIGDLTFRLPVWDWDSEDGSGKVLRPPSFVTQTSGNSLYDSRPFDPSDQPALADVRNDWSTSVMRQCFNKFAGTFNGINGSDGDSASEVFNGAHLNIHQWTGGHMGKLCTSGFDPLFYMHHANIDRIWAHRQHLRQQENFKTIEDLENIRDPKLPKRQMTFTNVRSVSPGNLIAFDEVRQISFFGVISSLGYSYQWPEWFSTDQNAIIPCPRTTNQNELSAIGLEFEMVIPSDMYGTIFLEAAEPNLPWKRVARSVRLKDCPGGASSSVAITFLPCQLAGSWAEVKKLVISKDTRWRVVSGGIVGNVKVPVISSSI